MEPGRIRPASSRPRSRPRLATATPHSRPKPALLLSESLKLKGRPSTARPRVQGTLRRAKSDKFVKYQKNLIQAMQKYAEIAQAQYERDKHADWKKHKRQILKLHNISSEHRIASSRKLLPRPVSASPALSKRGGGGTPASKRPTTAGARPSRTSNRPTSAPAGGAQMQNLPVRKSRIFETDCPTMRVTHDSHHHLSSANKELIRNKLTDIEASRDSRMGKLDRIKRSNMRKKDRSYRQKRADDLMDEGDKIVKLATKTPASSSTKTPYLKAADCFTDALFFEMDLPAAHASRANCWKHLDRYTLAYVDLSQAILKHSNPIPASYFASRAGILLHLKRYNDSLADLDDAIEINDVNPHAYYNRAVLLSEHTSPLNFDMALSDLNRAVLLMEKTMRIKLKKQGIVDTAVLNDSPVSFKVLHMAGSTEQQTDVKFVFKLRLLRGDIQRKKGLFQEALVDLREAASLDVTSGVAWNLLGQCNYATGLALEAEKCFTNAVDIDGENPLYYFDRGNAMLLVHEKKHKNEADLSDNDFLNNAVEDFTVATNLQTDREEYEEGESSPNPIVLQKLRYDRAEFHNGLAKACLAFEDEKHNTDALKSITVALEIQPKNHTFLFTSGMSYLALSDTKEAFSRFMKALKIFPEYCPALYQSALIFQDRKDYLIAYDNLTKCIACNNTGTKEEAVYFTRGLVLFDDGKLFDAQVDFKKALQLGSKRVDVYFYLGEAKRRSGDCVRALADFSVVEKLGKNSEIIESGRYRYARGISLSVIGDLENGLKDLVLAVDTDPHNTDYISAKADILARLGRFKEAEQVLRAGVDIALKTKAANTWSLLRKLSIALFKQDKHDESSKTMHRALLNSSQSMSPIEIADIYYKRGICLAHLKKHQRSYEMFDKALEVKEIHERPERILYTHERAKAAQMCGKHQDAITDFSVVTKMSPSDDRAFFRRAWSYKALGLFLLAAEDFETAVSLKPENKVYKLNYRAIGSIETIVLVPPGLEEIPKQIQDDWLASVIDPFVS